MAGRVSIVSLNTAAASGAKKSPTGRAVSSFSGEEVAWLDDALKALLTGKQRHMARLDGSAGVGVAQKVMRMKGAAARDATERAAKEDARRARVAAAEAERAMMAAVDNGEVANER